jgi:hypothetical protein
MSLISVVQDVCAVVGVARPSSIFSGLNSSRTQQEMLALANEMAQRIAYNTREWTQLYVNATLTGDGVSLGHLLPDNFKRMVLSANVRRSDFPTLPLRFIADIDEWAERRARGLSIAPGEWNISAGVLGVVPILPTGVSVHFIYIDKNCIGLNLGPTGAVGTTFQNDADVFRLDERLLKLGMVWQWKANKGSPYAEDMATYSDALAVAAGADKPMPIIVGRMPISAATNVAFPWPPDWGATTR